MEEYLKQLEKEIEEDCHKYQGDCWWTAYLVGKKHMLNEIRKYYD